MVSVLLDTHAWVWTLVDDPRLSDKAREAIVSADAVHVSPISFFEIGQKVRIGKWPEMEPHAASLPQRLREQGGLVAPLTPDICLGASLTDWPHRDPFDRIIAATAETTGDQLVSLDTAFDSFPGNLARIW
jgi:PIN domain nuclease of toxin-antitoxin system